MNLKVKMDKGWYYRNEVWFSEAFKNLPRSAIDLLQCFATEIRKKQKGRKWAIVNNGELSVTQSQFLKLTGYSKSTYIKERNRLIEHGFLIITYLGGGGSGDRSLYKLLICDDIPKEKQRWRRYPKEDWKHEVPKRENNLIGKRTQWKKGQSGKKIKYTL
jgi:hypothetical protein